MPKIIVMNAATEQMSGRHPNRTQQLLAAKTAWRSTWFAEAGDVIVTPVPMAPPGYLLFREPAGMRVERTRSDCGDTPAASCVSFARLLFERSYRLPVLLNVQLAPGDHL